MKKYNHYGASGTGKTYLDCALGNASCRNLFPTKHIRLQELLTDLTTVRGDATYKRVFVQYKRVILLIFDEWLLVPLMITESRNPLEFIKAQNQHARFAPAGWHDQLSESY
jgi:DNA replication protein DnaC